MDIQFKKIIGKTEFTFNVQAEGLKDFFEKVSVYEDIPTEGPNGETDLVIAFRTTKQGHKYYSVVCKSAKQEFKFGQSTDNMTMFPKGWEALYEAGAEADAVGLGQQQTNYIQQQPVQQAVQQPVGLGQPTVNTNIQPTVQQPAAVAVQPVVQAAVVAQPVVTAVVAQPVVQATVVAQPVVTAPAPEANAAVNDVLAKYGI